MKQKIPDVLPDFSIPVEKLEEEAHKRMQHVREALARVTEVTLEPTWQNTHEPLDDALDPLHTFMSALEHRNACVQTDELRTVHNKLGVEYSNLSVEIMTNKNLFDAYQKIQGGEEYAKLDNVQQRIINLTVRDFTLSGVALAKDEQEQYKEYTEKLTVLGDSFSNNTLDAKDGWFKHVGEADKETLAGLSEDILESAAKTAKEKGLDGWVFTLDAPSYSAVIQYAENRVLRKEMNCAFTTRASDKGPNAGKWDNAEIIDSILMLRDKRSRLLGFNNFAEFSLVTKMAENTDEVMSLIDELAKASKPKAMKELSTLKELAKRDDIHDFAAWDYAYYLEKWRQEEYAFSDDEVSKYFPTSKVIEGMFAITQKLYNVRLEEVVDVDTWHKDVRFYNMYDAEDVLISGVYMDLFARPKKRGGAWMDEPVIRRKTKEGIQLPVAFLTCNFTAPIDEHESYLKQYEVSTLFHEFGHCLNHMLTNIEYSDVSGINGVEWDAVELPSQFYEYWCWDKDLLQGYLTSHKETGEKIPGALLDKMIAAKNYASGLATVRQLEFALFDFLLHTEYDAINKNFFRDTLARARNQVAVLEYPEWNRYMNSFSHIFGGGYAAGYYSYKWAEVLAADAADTFIEGGMLDETLGEKFKNEVLARGGSRPAVENFFAFKGRKPNINALLRHEGLKE